MSAPEALEAAEWNISLAAKRLRKVAAILERLEALTGYAAPSWGVRTQGGSHATQAEVRVELRERLKFYAVEEIALARALMATDGERGRYCAGLLEGLSGEALRRRARLSKKALEECRRWLAGIVG